MQPSHPVAAGIPVNPAAEDFTGLSHSVSPLEHLKQWLPRPAATKPLPLPGIPGKPTQNEATLPANPAE